MSKCINNAENLSAYLVSANIGSDGFIVWSLIKTCACEVNKRTKQ